MHEAGILIISQEAQAYADLLADLPVTAFQNAADAATAASGQAIVLGEPHLVAAALPGLPKVRWVQSTWAGVAPLLPAAREGLQVTGVKDVFGPQMAEYALGYLLARELDVFERLASQHRREWLATDTGGLRGKTLGVMGTGSIGASIAARAAVFELRLLGYSRSGRSVPLFDRVYAAAQLHEFLGQCDYVVAVLPDTPATTHLLDADAFRAMRPGACLVNVGRGNLVDEPALAAALESGELAGAVLDVFQTEPLPDDHRFWRTPGLLITAHVAARSYPRDIATIFRDNHARWVAGRPLKYLLDPEQAY